MLRVELCTSVALGKAQEKDAKEERVKKATEVSMGKDIREEGGGGEATEGSLEAKGTGACVYFYPCLCL